MPLSRRDILCGVSAVTAGLALGGPAWAATASPDEVRSIPSTQTPVPVIGLGSWITFNVGNDPALLEQCADVIAAFADEGGGIIDCSPMYGSSTDTIGYVLERLDDPSAIFSAEKVWTSAPGEGPDQIARSAEKWGVSNFDLLQVHNLRAWEVRLDYLFAMKAAGRLGHVGVPLIATSYSSWQAGGHLGDCLRNMRSDFAHARELGVCVLLIDEIDAVRARSKRDDQGASYQGAVLNGMLEEIGKLTSVPGVFLLGASNHPDLLDPALVRSGRFDAKIPFSMPDIAAHEAILRGALGNALPATDLKPLAAQLSGQPGSDGPAAVRDAKSKARAKGRDLTGPDLRAALDRIASAPDPALDWRMAVHEAGHAMCAIYLGHPAPECVVIGRNSHVRWRQLRTSTLETLADQIAIDLAGHTAEALVLSETSTGSGGGAGCDLDLATRRALRLEVSFGWGASGMIWFDVDDPMNAQRCLADRAVRAAVEKRLSVAKKRATDILKPELDAIRTLARQLLSSRELSGQALLDAIVTARAAVSGTAETDKVVSFRRQTP